MRVIKYTVKISKSILDANHGFTRTIYEIFVPRKKIIFNIIDKELNVFKSDKPRYLENCVKQEIKISDDLINKLENYLKLKEECIKQSIKYFAEKESYDKIK